MAEFMEEVSPERTASTRPRKQGESTVPGLGKLVKAQNSQNGPQPGTGEASSKTTVVPPEPSSKVKMNRFESTAYV